MPPSLHHHQHGQHGAGVFRARVGGLVLSLALGALAYGPISVAQSKPAIPRSFTARALQRAGPAVVRIDAVRITPIGSHPLLSPAPDRRDSDPFLEQFFNRRRHQQELGAGVVFTKEGLILTTAQTVEKMDYHLDVHFSDGRTLPGKLVGVDFVTNLAVVKVVALPPFPMAPLGDSDALEVGDRVMVMGRKPSGMGNTVTTVTIINLNHQRNRRTNQDTTARPLELIRTDTAIDRGNAGGPLLNAAGEVIGINTLIYSGPVAHRGFAIPINTARAVAEELTRAGLSHPTVGARVRSLTPALAREFNQHPDNTGFQLLKIYGALIVDVRPQSPAEQAGLRAGDVVRDVEVNKVWSTVTSPAELFRAVDSTGVGKQLQLGIWRQKQRKQVTVVPEEMAEQMRRAMRDSVTPLPSPGPY